MITLIVATEHGLFSARRALDWSVEHHLSGSSAACVAVDPETATRVYCGTLGRGVWHSDDAGRSWEPAGPGVSHALVTSIAASPTEGGDDYAVVYAGTEPSALFRSTDGGASWSESSGLRSLPSAPTWSFPPRPETHHVRWIEPDPVATGRLFVAIEAGALLRTPDGGRTWEDRVPGGPYDTHTAATHRLAPDRVYSAAGDGYFESANAGRTWTRRMDGLRHHYLVGVAVDPEEPDTVIVSAAEGPHSAYSPRHAETHIYRRAARGAWRPATEGLPDPEGTTVSHFAGHPDEPGVLYAANNRGVYRTADAGRTWAALEIPWPPGALAGGVAAIAALPE